jgi:hypothetical protein
MWVFRSFRHIWLDTSPYVPEILLSDELLHLVTEVGLIQHQEAGYIINERYF